VQIIRTPEESSATKDVAGLMFECGDCHLVKPVPTGVGGTGYASGPTDKPDALICYDCCAIRDRAEMQERGIAVLYFTRHDGTASIGNWPGTLKFPVATYRAFRHPFARQAYHGTFTGPDGKLWRFRNVGDSEVAHCRRAAA
jgi:hypothetical protein